MADITVLGLGAMGSAIARKFLSDGHSVAVWNRSPDKAQVLTAEGAEAVDDLASAIRASDKILICVFDYAASTSLLDRTGIAEALHKRSVLQVTGGTPGDAAKADTWMRTHDVAYMDGAIMCYPGDLGTDRSQILVAGPPATFESWQTFLSALASDVRFVGENIRAAATLDMALLSRFVGLKFSAMHGAHICESEGVDLRQLSDLLPDGDNAKRMIETIASGDFTLRPGSASVNVAAAAWAAMQTQARARGINSDLPDLFLRWCESAASKGWGAEDNSCIIKVLRGQE